MRIPVRQLFVATLAAATFGMVACSDDSNSPNRTGQIRVLITDAPSDIIASATVWVSRVYLQGGGADDAPAVDLFNDRANPRSYDLLTLRDGITAALTDAVDVNVGAYQQLRFIVDSARVTLVPGEQFADGTTSRRLMVPSGAQTGIKVNLATALRAEEGETTTIVVDVDVDRNFVIQGNPGTPAGITGILFTPTLVELRRSTDGG
jgi:hypothetical protein